MDMTPDEASRLRASVTLEIAKNRKLGNVGPMGCPSPQLEAQHPRSPVTLPKKRGRFCYIKMQPGKKINSFKVGKSAESSDDISRRNTRGLGDRPVRAASQARASA